MRCQIKLRDFFKFVVAFSEYTNLKKELDLLDEPCEQRKLEIIEEMNQRLTEQVSSLRHVLTNTNLHIFFYQIVLCLLFESFRGKSF